MPDLDIKDAIMTRRYDLSDGEYVDIYVWKPEQNGDHDSFDCWYQIRGLDDEKPRYARGIDGFQALALAMLILSTLLYNSDAYKAGRLTFLGTRDLMLPHFPGEIPGTDEYQKANLLTTATYEAIVLMPDQRFPYIAYPGERLNKLIVSLNKIYQTVSEGPARKKFKRLIEGFMAQRKYYERICRDVGIDLSYFPEESSEEG